MFKKLKEFLNCLVFHGFNNSWIRFYKEMGTLIAILIIIFVLFVYVVNKISYSY